MVKFRQVWWVPIVLLCSVLACSKSTKYEDRGLTPYDRDEAELISLCLSGEMTALESLTDRIQNDLTAIRSTYGDRFRKIRGITFFPPWVEGCIIVGFDDTTYREVVEGNYHAWDQLNTQYQNWRIDTLGLNYTVLDFKGLLNPLRLAELYAVLPGVTSAEPSYLILFREIPNLYAMQTEHGITYLFLYVGNYPSGCVYYNEYWYFTFEGDRPVFVGHWKCDSEKPPDWWQEAKLNLNQCCK